MPGLIGSEYGIRLSQPTLMWMPEYGIGYLPLSRKKAQVYDSSYFGKYKWYAQTDLGKSLTSKRVEFVKQFYGSGFLLDYGIGCGDFIQRRQGLTLGWDINPDALTWLARHNLLGSKEAHYPAITFWDSLEHLEDPAEALSHADEWVFVSMPTYKGLDDVLSSKHFKPQEHIWYFTKEGFELYVNHEGFEVVSIESFESDLGRESISSFALRRTSCQ